MHEYSGDAESASTWDGIANSMRDAIRSQFNPEGYLPWGVGKDAPTMASPDITGYAVWSDILLTFRRMLLLIGSPNDIGLTR